MLDRRRASSAPCFVTARVAGVGVDEGTASPWSVALKGSSGGRDGVVRRCGRRTGRKPMSSMRSASSRTRILIVLERRRRRAPSGRSGGRAWRPAAGPCARRAGPCGVDADAAVGDRHLEVAGAQGCPRASSAIWLASSRVGASTSAAGRGSLGAQALEDRERRRRASCRSRWATRRGRRGPSSASGMTSFWTAKGSVMPRLREGVAYAADDTPRSANVREDILVLLLTMVIREIRQDPDHAERTRRLKPRGQRRCPCPAR